MLLLLSLPQNVYRPIRSYKEDILEFVAYERRLVYRCHASAPGNLAWDSVDPMLSVNVCTRALDTTDHRDYFFAGFARLDFLLIAIFIIVSLFKPWLKLH